MNRDGTPTSSQKSRSEPPASKWKAEIKRLAIAGGYVIAAIVAIVGILAHFSPSFLSHALLGFLGWPLGTQVLLVAGIATGTGVLAAAKQIYTSFQVRQAQLNIRISAEAAIGSTIVSPLRTIQRLLARIVELLEAFVSSSLPIASTSERQPGPSDTTESPRNAPSSPPDAAQPIPPNFFIGRTVELNWLMERLQAHDHEHDTTVIYGIPGIGKSALAQKAAELVELGRFKGAVTYINCHGMDDHVRVVQSALKHLEPDRQFPPMLDLEVLRLISEQLLTDQERLIILDGVEPGVHMEEVVHALRTSKRMAHILIVTTTTPSVDVAPIESQWELKELGIARSTGGTGAVDEALELFARYAGKESAKAFGVRVIHAENIVKALGRHTYALKLMGNYVRLQPHILHGVAKDVSKLQAGTVTPGLEGVLRPVWAALRTVVNDLTPEARKLLFAYVAAFEQVEAGRLATRALGEGLGLQDKDGAIHDLLVHRLMDSDDDDMLPPGSDRHRLKIHALLLGYVSYTVTKRESETWVTSARDAAASFYAGYVTRYDYRDPSRSTQTILERDADNITRSLEWAIANKQHKSVVSIAHGMRRYWHDRWLNGMTEQFMPAAVKSATILVGAAKQARDTTEENTQRGYAADLSFTLGRVYRRTGRLAEAERLFQHDLAFRKRQGQHAEQAEAYHQLAQLERSRGRMTKGLRYCRKGLAVVEQHLPEDSHNETQEVKKLLQAKGLLIAQEGRIQRSQGNLREADTLFAEALELFRRTGDLLEQGVALGYRGRIARVLGNLAQANSYFEQSNALALQVHDLRGQGAIATQFGRIARVQGDVYGSQVAFEEGLSLARQVLDRQAEAINLNYLGRIANTRGNTREAREYFTDALNIAEEIGDRLDQGVNLHYLGRIAKKEGDRTQARRYFRDSLKILRKVEDRRGQALVLAQMGLLDIGQGHLTWAGWRLRRSLQLIRQVGDRRSEGTLLLCHGQLDVAKGETVSARTHFEEALERARELGDASGEKEALEWLNKLSIPRDPST